MTNRAGRSQLYIEIDDSGGTARNLTPDVEEVRGFGKSFRVLRVSGVDDDGERVSAGLQEAVEVVIEGDSNPLATTGSDTVLSGLLGGIGTISFGPYGNHSGTLKFSGEYLLKRWTLDTLKNGDVKFRAVFVQDAVVTVGTW